MNFSNIKKQVKQDKLKKGSEVLQFFEDSFHAFEEHKALL
jgi:hypothetical protein